MEPERGEQDVVRDAVVESSSRIDHLTEHPGSGTAASDQLDVAAIGSPVPMPDGPSAKEKAH